MENLAGLRLALSISAAALLAACGGSQPPIGAPGAMALSHAVAAQHAVRSGSWMVRDAKSIKQLLYVSDDQTEAVYVYDYKTRGEVGELTGFSFPYGQCVDKNGDVFLTTETGSTGQVLEYAHGGTQPIQTFETAGHPIGCSIARKSGDLAVGVGLPSGGTAIEVWKHAAGYPSQYSNQSDCPGMWPPGYDKQGNLFFETGNHYSVCELPAGGTSIIQVVFNHYLTFPGSVMWDGKYMSFTDQDALGYNSTAIYQAQRNTSGGLDVIGTTMLENKRCGVDVIQPFIVGRRNTPVNDTQGYSVVGGNIACYNSKVEYWHYPGGKQNFKGIPQSPQDVTGQSVSIGPSR